MRKETISKTEQAWPGARDGVEEIFLHSPGPLVILFGEQQDGYGVAVKGKFSEVVAMLLGFFIQHPEIEKAVVGTLLQRRLTCALFKDGPPNDKGQEGR